MKMNMNNCEVDNGRNSDESSTNVDAQFKCESCGEIYTSRQELKEHTERQH
jgi:hypothetical protein